MKAAESDVSINISKPVLPNNTMVYSNSIYIDHALSPDPAGSVSVQVKPMTFKLILVAS